MEFVLWCVCVSGEILEAGISSAMVLQSDEAVVVTAQEEFDDILPNGEMEGERERGGKERKKKMR